MKRLIAALLLASTLAIPSAAKNEPITLMWPTDKPIIKLTFDKFRQQGGYGGENVYLTDVVAENLTDKQIPRAYFTVYLLDKNNIRVGQGSLLIADLDPKQIAKMQFQFNAVGTPVNLTISARGDVGAKTIPLRVLTTPPGAALKVDGSVVGVTPVIVRFTVGVHQLVLNKEGYAQGNTPIEVTSDELPGGSITIELGGLSRDTVELRDGTVLLGDVISLSMTEVVVNVDGRNQTYPRNQVKKLMLVERVIQQQPATIQPSAVTPK
jgi:hypothetical protein